jgi:hypothetical protein
MKRLPSRARPSALLALLALAAAATGVSAQNEIVIYRCVDAAGAVTLQNDVPCPKGSQQTVRRVAPLPVRAPPPPTVVVPAVAAPAPPPAASPAPTVAEVAPPPAVRGAPPPLFRCRTWDDRDYLGDSGEPPATCVPLQTVGIDGSPSLAAGSACEMRRDACEPVPAEQLCTAWKKRVDEAEFRWKFGGGRDDARKADFERVAAIYRDSDCVR